MQNQLWQHWQARLLLTLCPKSPQTLLSGWGQVISSWISVCWSLPLTGHLWKLRLCWTMPHLLRVYLTVLFWVSASLTSIRTSLCLVSLCYHPISSSSPTSRPLQHTTMAGRLISLPLCYQCWLVICRSVLHHLSWHGSMFSDLHVPLADSALRQPGRMDVLVGVDIFVAGWLDLLVCYWPLKTEFGWVPSGSLMQRVLTDKVNLHVTVFWLSAQPQALMKLY